MIGMRFEVRYSPKEKIWYVYDEEGSYYHSDTIEDIPYLIKKHIEHFRTELQFMVAELKSEE